MATKSFTRRVGARTRFAALLATTGLVLSACGKKEPCDICSALRVPASEE